MVEISTYNLVIKILKEEKFFDLNLVLRRGIFRIDCSFQDFRILKGLIDEGKVQILRVGFLKDFIAVVVNQQ